VSRNKRLGQQSKRGRHKKLRSPETRKWNRVTNGTRLLREQAAS